MSILYIYIYEFHVTEVSWKKREVVLCFKSSLQITYSPDKSRADISPRLFQVYWATAYLPVAYC